MANDAPLVLIHRSLCRVKATVVVLAPVLFAAFTLPIVLGPWRVATWQKSRVAVQKRGWPGVSHGLRKVTS